MSGEKYSRRTSPLPLSFDPPHHPSPPTHTGEALQKEEKSCLDLLSSPCLRDQWMGRSLREQGEREREADTDDRQTDSKGDRRIIRAKGDHLESGRRRVGQQPGTIQKSFFCFTTSSLPPDQSSPPLGVVSQDRARRSSSDGGGSPHHLLHLLLLEEIELQDELSILPIPTREEPTL
jgi:hypothetical protein